MNQNLPAVIEASARAQGLSLAACNMMLPSETYGAVLGVYDKITLEVIRIDPNPEAGDVFEIAKGKFSLGKVPLERIANALSIQWHPQYTGIVESTATRSRAKAVGIMKKPNGESITQTDEKTIDLDVVADELREKAEKDSEGGRIIRWEDRRPIKEPWKSDAECAEYIEREVRKGLMQKRKFKDELALTGAKDRVIRAFIATKSTYTAVELQKPFAFPRVTLDTSKMLDDPRMRAAAIGMIGGAAADLYGPRAAPAKIAPPAVQHEEEPRNVIPIDAKAEATPDDDWDDIPTAPSSVPDKSTMLLHTLEEYIVSGILSPKAQETINAAITRDERDPIILQNLVDRCKAFEDKIAGRAS
jgi:hypothetical protein